MKIATIISCNDNYDYDTRTKYVSEFLKKRGFTVNFLVSDFDHRNKCHYQVEREDVIHYIHVKPYSKNLSLSRIIAQLQFAKGVGDFINGNTPDLVYHCAPPNSTIAVLAKIRKKKNFKLITEIGDMWPETIPVKNGVKKALSVPLAFWSGLRNKNLENSDLVIAECDLFKDILIEKSNARNVSTIYFCKPFIGTEQDGNINGIDKISFCYLGSINNIIDIDLIISFFEKIIVNNKIDFHIIGDGEKREELISRARKVGVEVYFHGVVFDSKQKQDIFKQCHYALNIMKETVCVGMTMKSLDYFSFGIPMINNIGGDIWNMVDKYIIGFNLKKDCINETVDKIVATSQEEYLTLRDNVKRTHAEFFDVTSFELQLTNILDRG